MTIPDRVGRWGWGDIAEDVHTKRLYRVIGFIMSPAVVFHAITEDGDPLNQKVGSSERIEVAGCLNEVTGLRRYARDEFPPERS